MKKIVVINGVGGSGKDTFVEFCKKYMSVTNFSSIDKVKEIAKLIGWNGTKSEKDRKFLSDLKKLTTEYNDMSYKSVVDAINLFNNSENEILFIHIREPEEIMRIVDEFNAITLLIKRLDINPINSNYSDASVNNYNYDYIIENTTLEELDMSAKNFIKKLKSVK